MGAPRWRCVGIAAALLALTGGARAGVENVNITLDYIAQKALERAHKAFHSPRGELPDFLKADKLDYDKYRLIRFRPERSLWAADKLPFEVQFFHPGYLYQEPVHINEFVPGHSQDVRFVSDFFDYQNLRFPKQVPPDTGYAGFKVLYALNEANKMDELGSFLGASYYRLLGKGQRYGPSARGLALDCGETDRPEEFPLFTDWWLGKPEPKATELHLFAILDSVSCAGAYEFVIHPGESTAAEIHTVIYFREPDKIAAVDPKRKPLMTIGMAPLTSMFWIGPASEARFDDYRPGVHDSDGLMMQFATGETVWRPLDDPPRLVHQHFAATNIVGFGLLQRNRDFAAYQDLFNEYYKVPGIWIKPREEWGEGDVNLVELHTTYEGLDNIVAFWNPKNKPAPLQPLRFSYMEYWTRETDMNLSTNKVVATMVGDDISGPNRKQFAVDFNGPALFDIPVTNPPVVAMSCSENGKMIDSQVFKVPETGAWRVMMKFEPKSGDKSPIDLRCCLERTNKPLTETWTYCWNPP